MGTDSSKLKKELTTKVVLWRLGLISLVIGLTTATTLVTDNEAIIIVITEYGVDFRSADWEELYRFNGGYAEEVEYLRDKQFQDFKDWQALFGCEQPEE